MARNPFYKDHWINIDQERLDRYERMFQWNPASSTLYEPAGIRPGHIVADFGCGPGHTAIEIAKWVGPGGHVHALDINSDFVSQSRKNADAAGVGDKYRSAEDQAHRLPDLVDDLVRQRVALIVGNTRSAKAAKAATTTVPIVFVSGEDPVINGLVASLSRPSGNTTGVSFLSIASVTKRLELLRQLVPKPGAIAMLMYPVNTPDAERELRDVQAAAQASGQELMVVEAATDRDIETAFARFAQGGAVALFIGSHAFFNSRRERVAALAVRYALPAAYALREFATAGGLMSYGTSITGAYRLGGIYAGILKGEKPVSLSPTR